MWVFATALPVLKKIDYNKTLLKTKYIFLVRSEYNRM